jgi:hypothetical protein
MSEARIGPASLSLLLQLLEAPEPILSGEALHGPYCAAAGPLLAAGLLTAADYEPVTTSLADHDDSPVTLSRSDDATGFGYFSASAGWVNVPDRVLTRHRLNIPQTLHALGVKLDPSRRVPAERVVDDVLWDLGAVRLGRRPRRTSLWFGRRLSIPASYRRAREALRSRPSDGTGLLLTSTSPSRLPPEGIQGAVIVWIPDVLEAGEELRIDPRVLAARLDMIPAQPSEPSAIKVIGDGRIVHFQGRVFRFEKGEQQRRIIMALYDRFVQGHEVVPSAEIVVELGLPATARIRDYFKSPAHAGLIFDRRGLCGFDVGEK